MTDGKLPETFYRGSDVVAISRQLLGKVLCTHLDGRRTELIVTETEAYAGVADGASHAHGGRRTDRTEPMYATGGIAYVYLCYGIHHLFNVVTNDIDIPHAILIRAGAPLHGIDVMLERRGKVDVDRTLLAGPGSLAKALGISTALTGTSLTGDRIWIEDRGIDFAEDKISVGPRIGVDYAGDDAHKPYRFVVDPADIQRSA